MRSFINRMVCFLIVGLMAVSGTFPAMAADDPTWPSLQQSQAEFPAAQDTDVNTDMGIVKQVRSTDNKQRGSRRDL